MTITKMLALVTSIGFLAAAAAAPLLIVEGSSLCHMHVREQMGVLVAGCAGECLEEDAACIPYVLDSGDSSDTTCACYHPDGDYTPTGKDCHAVLTDDNGVQTLNCITYSCGSSCEENVPDPWWQDACDCP